RSKAEGPTPHAFLRNAQRESFRPSVEEFGLTTAIAFGGTNESIGENNAHAASRIGFRAFEVRQHALERNSLHRVAIENGGEMPMAYGFLCRGSLRPIAARRTGKNRCSFLLRLYSQSSYQFFDRRNFRRKARGELFGHPADDLIAGPVRLLARFGRLQR